MNITPLYELKDRLRAASIAGTALLSEDFRLKKAAEGFKALESASPVFKKISEQTDALLSDKCDDRAGVLLDTITLADSVICTLGATDVSGEISDIPAGSSNMGIANVPYSKLSVITDALTASGSGKMEALVYAWRDDPELFRDFRVMPALVTGLGASYAELADYVQTIVGKLGADMLPFLKKGFDPKGKKEMVRRVRAIENICLAEDLDETPFFMEQLETAEKDVRAALIYAFRHNENNIDKLLEFANTEKGKPKTVAITALARFNGEKPEAFFEEYAKKKPTEVLEILKITKADWTSDFTARLFESLLVDKNGNKFTYSEMTKKGLYTKCGASGWTLLNTLWGKTGSAIEKIYRDFDDPEYAPMLSDKLAQTIAATGDEGLKKLAVELNTKSPMKGHYIVAEGVARLMSGKDCSEWIKERVIEIYNKALNDKTAKSRIIEKSQIYNLLRRIKNKNGRFVIENMLYDIISDCEVFNDPIVLDQPIKGAFTDILMEYPCEAFDRVLEEWHGEGEDAEYSARLAKYFIQRVTSPKGETWLARIINRVGGGSVKGIIRGFCESHRTDVSTLQDLIFIIGYSNEYRLTETREVIELMRQGKLKTLSSEKEINELAEWNEKKHNTAG